MLSTTIAFSLAPVPTPLHIAVRKRWIEQCFMAQGIAIQDLCEHPMGDTHHFYHSHAKHFRVGGCFSATWAKANGADTKVVSAFWIPSRTDLLVRPDSRLTSPDQLRGCRLTIPVRDYLPVDYPRASAWYAYATILAAHGIDLDEVTFVPVPTKRLQHVQQEGVSHFLPHSRQRPNLPQKEEAETIHRQQADVMLTQLGRGALHIHQGFMRSLYHLLPEPDERKPPFFANAYPVLTLVNRAFAEENPELVTQWLRLEFMAGIWSMDNPQDSAEALAGMTDIPVSLLKDAYLPNFHQHMLPDIGAECFNAVRLIKEFMMRHRLLSRDFPENDWIDTSFFQNVKAILKPMFQ
jgi:ABC-type nitrate/sulfonate/bicarbonate transport system substrate-binding protein